MNSWFYPTVYETVEQVNIIFLITSVTQMLINRQRLYFNYHQYHHNTKWIRRLLSNDRVTDTVSCVTVTPWQAPSVSLQNSTIPVCSFPDGS